MKSAEIEAAKEVVLHAAKDYIKARDTALKARRPWGGHVSKEGFALDAAVKMLHRLCTEGQVN
jgi:hypothetical protein